MLSCLKRQVVHGTSIFRLLRQTSIFLVTPKDFKYKEKNFEGSLRELTEREKKTYPEYGTLTFPPISRPAYLSAAGNYITMAHVHNVREEERKGRRRRYER